MWDHLFYRVFETANFLSNRWKCWINEESGYPQREHKKAPDTQICASHCELGWSLLYLSQWTLLRQDCQNPACTFSSFWGFVICFEMWAWRRVTHVTNFFYCSWELFYHFSSPSSPSHCKLSFGYPSLWWLHICSPALPHFTPAMSLVSSSPLFPYNVFLCVLSWQDQQTNNIMYLSLGTEKMTDEPNTPWVEKERKNSTWQGSWTTYASPSLSSSISQEKHSRKIGL